LTVVYVFRKREARFSAKMRQIGLAALPAAAVLGVVLDRA
jgi:hypothetical protein